MLIPWQTLSPDALTNIIESAVLSEGTDYGETELSFDEKVQQLASRVKTGDAVIVFSEADETVAIRSKDEFSPLS